MVNLPYSQKSNLSQSTVELVEPDESVAVVDDSPEIVLLLSHYLKAMGLKVVRAGSAGELYHLLDTEKIALILLDIGLPDQNGDEILEDIIPSHPDLGIIMVTGTTDIEVALNCLRLGADDYLTKPVSINQFHHSVLTTLQKRHLAITNRIYQQELQKTNTRMRFLHHLNLKMNTAYLNTVELTGILRAILVGITSDDGLRFNRAFLALYNENNSYLDGKLAIGPATREDAGRLWNSIKARGLQLDDILNSIQDKSVDTDVEVNRIIQTLHLSTLEHDHVFIHASHIQKPVHVTNGQATGCVVPEELLHTLGESSFVVVPLYSPGRPLGVMIVDNFVTRSPISIRDIGELEIFASQASLAIEHSHLYADMQKNINELETVTQELDKKKDLLLNAERDAVIGQMSAHLLHSIRNPLTSIGGTSRLLSRKINDSYMVEFLGIITKEANKIETILKDLFSFVETDEFSIEIHAIHPLLRKSVMMFYTTMKNQNITYSMNFNEEGPAVAVDDSKIRQVFLHLIRNGVEAMPNGGNLLIATTNDNKEITISITDTGQGIPTDSLPHVKDPFFTTKTYGTGMGLALVERIIKAHHGKFTIQDAPEGGTVATISLPIPESA
jgi:signal transduction histidine kinase/DNA-binding response OmpR family regulator